jgi:lysophospholipase L1-like esterase
MLGYSYEVKNFGVCGASVSLNSTIPYVDQPEFKKALDFDPDIIVVMLGTNDANPEIAYSEDNFKSDYTRIIRSFQSLHARTNLFVKSPIFTSNSFITTRT